jgi:hypothetical protein
MSAWYLCYDKGETFQTVTFHTMEWHGMGFMIKMMHVLCVMLLQRQRAWTFSSAY